jgi:hemolysin activation/secretion protein
MPTIFVSDFCKRNGSMVRRYLLGALVGLTSSAGVHAQAPMPAVLGAQASFAITGFEVTGESPIPQSRLQQLLAPFISPQATLETLQKATAALEAEFKAKGFALHRVSLPPQELGGTVRLSVVKFVVGQVRVLGASRYSEANVRASVPELQEGQAPNFQVLSVQTAIANENPGKQVQVSIGESEQADKIDATLSLRETSPESFSISLANTGSESTGRDRLSLVAAHANLWGLDHQVSAAYTSSLERWKDVKQLGLNYRIPFYEVGGMLAMSHTRSDVVGNFGAFNSTGAGQTLGISYSHYFAPLGARRSYASVGLDEKRFEATLINGVPAPGQLKRSSRPLTLGYTARVENEASQWGYNLELATNLPGSGGNSLSAYQSEDPRISRVQWRALRGGANYQALSTAGWLLSARTQFQWSPDALISGEQFGIGGASSVRGTAERPIAGDSGLFATLEASRPVLFDGLRAVTFLDAGWLANREPGVNANKPASDQLLSAGLGLRWARGSYGISAEWARVITGSVLPSAAGSGIPQSGDQKLHINLSARF